MVFAADYPFFDVFWTMIIFFVWVIWVWTVIAVFVDVFSRHDLSGWGKAAWIVFVVVLPWLGVLIYLIANGSKMPSAGHRTHRLRVPSSTNASGPAPRPAVPP